MPKLIGQETLCCGYRRCIEAKFFDDGSVTISDDDAETGSIGTIKIRPEAAARLVELLVGHVKK